MNPKPLSVSFLIVPSAISYTSSKISQGNACNKLFRRHRPTDVNVEKESSLGYHVVENRTLASWPAWQGAPMMEDDQSDAGGLEVAVRHHFFRASRNCGDSARVKSTTSSPVTVLIS